ncbi:MULTISPECIES: class II aldolase/adducin family protein [Acidiphilium]|jgi:L-fuculose-phosphate aldolase|uniref:class II aldolase/adducin family protein n=1 Tax=Acidiphilium TaxID=522 RepID=UPI00021450E1|nr:MULTISPECIES: class II aldolase/adducin family protein [Acidiphilium]EGO96750.1 L-fuculose-phosphate aldolase [Acidiphilium sp. PM]UNC16503.1 class II aldolase [Acidiphilium multivorum]
MKNLDLRKSLVDACRRMNALGINQGTSGNISIRSGNTMLISPSATPYDQMQPETVATMAVDGEYGAWDGPLRPSTEWRFHLDIMRARPEVNAIVHTHATFATILAIARKDIPACHYMIAAFGGYDVRCAPYATFGTKDLSNHAIAALEGRMGCLLANHGMIVLGENLDKAMWRAIELETIARQYYHALLLGNPYILSNTNIDDTLAKFADYGVQDKIPVGAT